jgi:hypothetical protein
MSKTPMRIFLCLAVPFFWPWRLAQRALGFPVDMRELNRQIAELWYFDPETQRDSREQK